MPKSEYENYQDFADRSAGLISALGKQTYKDAVNSMSRAAHLRGVTELLRIADIANPPAYSTDPEFSCGEVTLPADNGWKVIFHYRADGSLSYISEFVSPTGQKVDFWDWDDGVPGRKELMAWCRVGHGVELLANLHS